MHMGIHRGIPRLAAAVFKLSTDKSCIVLDAGQELPPFWQVMCQGGRSVAVTGVNQGTCCPDSSVPTPACTPKGRQQGSVRLFWLHFVSQA
jgi:hypothetical protein